MAKPNTKAFLKTTSTRENASPKVQTTTNIKKVDVMNAAKDRNKNAMPGWTGKC